MTPQPLRGKTWYPPQLITQFYLNASQLRAIARLQVLAEAKLTKERHETT